ncbi:MAG: hypothetical protein Q7U37_03435 [Gallionella sp.]|nr:hypothetical protein [Gallionella sp.]MDP1939867.1 hypothetical protein [Gallionella sp.]
MTLLPQKLAWYSRRTLEQIGLPGVVGLGLLAFCAIFYLGAIVPTGHEMASLKSAAAAKVPLSQQPDQLSPDRQLTEFYGIFPKLQDKSDALDKLHEAAVAQGVTFAQGEYHLLRNGADKLARYEIVLPIKSDYLHLRIFLSQALADMPYLSLDSVEFQRQKISDTVLDAQVKMTLFLAEE